MRVTVCFPIMATIDAQPVRRRTQWRKLLLVVACLLAVPVVLVAIGYGYAYHSAKQELEAEIARVRARGEPVWFAELGQGISEEAYQNGDRLVAALSRLKPPSDAFYERVANDSLPPGDYAEFREALETNREMLAEIAKITSRGDICFRYDWDTPSPYSVLLPHIQELRNVTRLLVADSRQSLGTRDDDRAVAAVCEHLDLAETLRGEPFFVSQLSRTSFCYVAKFSLQFTLPQVDLNGAQFGDLDGRLRRMRETFQLAPSVRAERAMVFTAMNRLDSNELREIFDMDDTQSWQTWFLATPLARPSLFFEQTFLLQRTSDLAPLVDAEGPAAAMAFDAQEQKIVNDAEHLPLNRLVFPAVGPMRKAGMRHRNQLDSARMALRVDRYRDRHGELPGSLTDVLDDQMQNVPLGTLSGQPLTYVQLDNGFAIYDVDPTTGEESGRFDVVYPHGDEQQASQ